MHRHGWIFDCIFGEKTIETMVKALENNDREFLLKAHFHTII